MKKTLAPALLLSLCLALAGCSGGAGVPGEELTELEQLEAAATVISLEGGTAEIEGPGASFENGLVTLSAGGSYLIRGSLENGRILVDTGETKQEVELILESVSIHCENDAALYVERAEKTRIYVKEGEPSRLSTGAPRTDSQVLTEASGAAVYGEDDLDFMGPGTLIIEGNINNGIGCKNDVDVNGGVLEISAANHGIKGNESVDIKGGQVSISCLNDGLKTDDAEKEGKGSVNITGGALNISAQDQGISSIKDINITGGEVNIVSQRDGLNADKELGGSVNISGGSIMVSSGNDAIDASGGVLSISGGSLLALGKDKDIKAAVEASIPCYAGSLKLAEGETLELRRASGESLVSQSAWEIKTAYIALADASDGEELELFIGSGEERESRGSITLD